MRIWVLDLPSPSWAVSTGTVFVDHLRGHHIHQWPLEVPTINIRPIFSGYVRGYTPKIWPKIWYNTSIESTNVQS